jgi:hypothetical protein
MGVSVLSVPLSFCFFIIVATAVSLYISRLITWFKRSSAAPNESNFNRYELDKYNKYESSDMFVTNANMTLEERAADQFAARLGYGGDLAQAMAVMETYRWNNDLIHGAE